MKTLSVSTNFRTPSVKDLSINTKRRIRSARGPHLDGAHRVRQVAQVDATCRWGGAAGPRNFDDIAHVRQLRTLLQVLDSPAEKSVLFEDLERDGVRIGQVYGHVRVSAT